MLSWGDTNSPRRPSLLPKTLRQRSRRSMTGSQSIELPPATVSYTGARAHLDPVDPAPTRTSTSMGRAGLMMTTVYGTADAKPSIATGATGSRGAWAVRRHRSPSFPTGVEGYVAAPVQAAG